MGHKAKNTQGRFPQEGITKLFFIKILLCIGKRISTDHLVIKGSM
jgi:hypothetical protein